MFIHMSNNSCCTSKVSERLSASMFLDCLQRFIARRGKPNLIFSNNTPQFRLVKTILDWQWNKVFESDEVLSFFSVKRIQWDFTTAIAPWQGGFYKRLVGLVKQSLRKGRGAKLLHWDKLMIRIISRGQGYCQYSPFDIHL